MHGIAYYRSTLIDTHVSVLEGTFDGDPKADGYIASGAVVDVEVRLIIPLVAALIQLKPQQDFVTGHPLTICK